MQHDDEVVLPGADRVAHGARAGGVIIDCGHGYALGDQFAGSRACASLHDWMVLRSAAPRASRRGRSPCGSCRDIVHSKAA